MTRGLDGIRCWWCICYGLPGFVPGVNSARDFAGKEFGCELSKSQNTSGLQSKDASTGQAAPAFSAFSFNPNYLIGLCLFIYFPSFFFSLDLSMRAGLRQPTDCKRPFHSNYIDCRKPSLILSLELMHSCICTAEKWITSRKKVMMTCVYYKYRT